MKNFLRILAVIGSFIVLGALPSIARAQCTPTTMYVTGPAVINIDPTVAVGTSLWSSSVNVGAGTGTCIGGYARIDYDGIGTQEPVYYTFPTGVAGIGVRMKYLSGALSTCLNIWFGKLSNNGKGCYAESNWSSGTIAAHTVFVEFIKTGPITVSGSTSGYFAQWATEPGASSPPKGSTVAKYVGLVWGYYAWTNPVLFNVAVPTCTVTMPNITVPMGSVPLNSFTGLNSTAASQPLNISLTCAGGKTNSYTNVWTTLTDATNPGNVSSVLSLTPTSTATGIGIQVLNGTTPVSYGPDSSTAGNTNQWFAGQAQNGAFNIPLTARYIQTGTTVSPGSANGRATFTMSYQ